MPIRNKEDAHRVLRHVSDEKRFYCHDGKILNNLYELKNALENISHACYIHHVTEEKNDFARWVRDVLGDDKLANDLAKAHAGNAVAIVSPKTSGGYLVSVRVPRESSVSAEAFCRRFPTGGGRRTAAGINDLPGAELEGFATLFEEQFRAG